MKLLTVKTSKTKEVVDITEKINNIIGKMGFQNGLCNIFVMHTTAGLTTADLDPGTDLDMIDAFNALIPNLKFRHPHNPAHVPDHILSSLIGTSLILPVQNGKLVLGMWQRVVLIEFDGPQERTITLSLWRQEN